LTVTSCPLHEYFVRKTGRVSLSAFACSVVVVIAFLIPMLFMVALAINQLLALGDSLQGTFASGAVGAAYFTP
jgi:hypothetical protein